MISYEAIGNIDSTQGAKAMRNFTNAFAASKLHSEIICFGGDLDEVALWKDDACAPQSDPLACATSACALQRELASARCASRQTARQVLHFTAIPEDEAARVAALEEATEALELARTAHASAMGTGDAQLIEAAHLRLSSAEADFVAAPPPAVNVPLNFVFSKSGCAMASFALKTHHQIHPTNLSICGDVSNMCTTTATSPSTLTASPTPQATAARRCSLGAAAASPSSTLRSASSSLSPPCSVSPARTALYRSRGRWSPWTSSPSPTQTTPDSFSLVCWRRAGPRTVDPRVRRRVPRGGLPQDPEVLPNRALTYRGPGRRCHNQRNPRDGLRRVRRSN